jgi:hypothetical protein
MHSLKSILGSSLIEEKTQIPRHRTSFKDVIVRYVAELKVRLAGQRQGKADRASDILANDGIRLGGTDYDCCLGLGLAIEARRRYG